MFKEKKVSYTTTNTYGILNDNLPSTENIWLVFHGLGYLSKYFIRYFDHLDPDKNRILAPQAPSKYYQGTNFKHVGASWLTRENTSIETQNVLSYIDAVMASETIRPDQRFIVLGYSQGVSIATRWLASRKVQCDHLVLHSGGIPTELTAADFSYLDNDCRVTYLYGNKDEYITEARKTEESLKGDHLFGSRLEIEVFEGIHEVHRPALTKIATPK